MAELYLSYALDGPTRTPTHLRGRSMLHGLMVDAPGAVGARTPCRIDANSFAVRSSALWSARVAVGLGILWVRHVTRLDSDFGPLRCLAGSNRDMSARAE